MAYDRWRVAFWEDKKETEFVLILQDSKLRPGSPGWKWLSTPASEEVLRRALDEMNIPDEKATAAIAKARTRKTQ